MFVGGSLINSPPLCVCTCRRLNVSFAFKRGILLTVIWEIEFIGPKFIGMPTRSEMGFPIQSTDCKIWCLTVKHASTILHCVKIPAPDWLCPLIGQGWPPPHDWCQPLELLRIKFTVSVKSGLPSKPSDPKLSPTSFCGPACWSEPHLNVSSSPTFFYLTEKGIKIPFHWTRKRVLGEKFLAV